MTCTYRPKCNSLWSIWYCVFVLLIHAYTLYIGISRYTDITHPEVTWPQGKPEFVLYLYIILHAVAIAFIPVFIATACFKTGNLAGDGEKLGYTEGKKILEVGGSPICSCVKALWQHGPPVAQSAHLAMSFALLMAHHFLDTDLIRHRVLDRDADKWSMQSLEFLYTSQSLLVKLVPNFTIPLNVYNVPAKLVPTVVSTRLYGISIVFINYVVALLIFAVRYPAVFWRSNKSFSFIFSIVLVLHAVEAVFAYLGFSILHRLQASGDIKAAFSRGNGKFYLLEPSFILIAVYLASVVLTYFSSTVLYGYGYNRYCLSLLQNQVRYRIRRNIRVHCDGYFPNAVAIIFLLLLVGCKAPFFYDQLVLSQQLEKHNTVKQVKLFCCIGATVIYIFSWLVVWLIFTLKREWQFKVHYTAYELWQLVCDNSDAIKDRNGVLVLCGNETYISQDPNKCKAIMAVMEQGESEDVYWLKPQHSATLPNPKTTNNSTNHVINTVQHQHSPPQNTIVLHDAKVVTPTHHTEPVTTAQMIMDFHPDNLVYSRSGHNQGIYDISPEQDDRKIIMASQKPPPSPSTRFQRQQQLGQRTSEGNLFPPGSYVRFNDENMEFVPDAVTTFGTMPRGPNNRVDYRRRVPQNEIDFYNTNPTVYVPPSTYASVQKVRPLPSPTQRQRQQPSDYNQLDGTVEMLLHQGDQDPQGHSRASSYSNVPHIPVVMQQPMINPHAMARTSMTSSETGVPTHYSTGVPVPRVSGSEPRYSSYASVQNPMYTDNYEIVPGADRQRIKYSPATASESIIISSSRYSPKHSPTAEIQAPYQRYGSGNGNKLSSFEVPVASKPVPISDIYMTGGGSQYGTMRSYDSRMSREETPDYQTRIVRMPASLQASNPDYSQGMAPGPMYGQYASTKYENRRTSAASNISNQNPIAATIASNPISNISDTASSNSGTSASDSVKTPTPTSAGFSQPVETTSPNLAVPVSPVIISSRDISDQQRQDSANFSLTSSNESDPTVVNNQNQYSSSIV